MALDKKQAIKELERFNAHIADAYKVRHTWTQENYMAFAEFKPGDKIYGAVAANDYKLQYAGIVTQVILDKHESLRSDAPVIVYEFDTAPGWNYGGTTSDSHYVHYHNEEHWKQVKLRQLTAIQKQIELGQD